MTSLCCARRRIALLAAMGIGLAPLIAAPTSADPVVFWDFEDGVDGRYFGDDPDGGSVDTVRGVVMYGAPSPFGPSWTSLTSDGTGLGVSIAGNYQDAYTLDPTLNAWSPSTWTIETTVHLEEIDGWETLIGRDGSSQGEVDSDFYLANNGIDDKFRINIDTVGGTRWILDGDYAVQANRWYAVAAMSDGETLSMWLNDSGSGYQQIGSLDISAQSVADNALAATDYNWTFGRGWYNGGFVDHIDGRMDNVRFSDVALASEDLIPLAVIAEPPLPGDYGNDGVVDAADYTVWRDHLGTSADLPNDTTPGWVTAEDYDVWCNHFGESLVSGSVAAAPEPRAIVLLGLGVLFGLGVFGALAMLRRRR